MSDTPAMSRVRTVLTRPLLGGLLLLAPVALAGSAHAADELPAPTPADPYVPPAQKQLSPADIVITRGPEPRQLSFSTRQGSPLALLLVTTSDDGRVRVTSPGTDFTQPSTWRQFGFGDLCWRTTPPDPDSFVLPEPTLPFVGPPGTWQYSNVIVSTVKGPVVYNKPLPNEYVTGQGAAMEGLIACVVPAAAQGARQGLRADIDDENPIAVASRAPVAPGAVVSPLPIAPSTPTAEPVTPEVLPTTPEPVESSTSQTGGGVEEGHHLPRDDLGGQPLHTDHHQRELGGEFRSPRAHRPAVSAGRLGRRHPTDRRGQPGSELARRSGSAGERVRSRRPAHRSVATDHSSGEASQARAAGHHGAAAHAAHRAADRDCDPDPWPQQPGQPKCHTIATDRHGHPESQ